MDTYLLQRLATDRIADLRRDGRPMKRLLRRA